MWIKLVGCIVIMGSAVLLGMYYGNCLTRRLAALRQLYQAMQLLKGEICYRHATLSEAFTEVGRRCGHDVGAWMEALGRKIMDRRSATFMELWLSAVETISRQGAFSQEDIGLLREFGKNLGYLDLQMQENRILFFMEQLDVQMKELLDTMKERQRLYRTLSILGGCFLIVVLL